MVVTALIDIVIALILYSYSNYFEHDSFRICCHAQTAAIAIQLNGLFNDFIELQKS